MIIIVRSIWKGKKSSKDTVHRSNSWLIINVLSFKELLQKLSKIVNTMRAHIF